MTAVLYIIMRNDIDSMNPGKAIAQGSHAANAFVHHFEGFAQEYNSKPVHNSLETANMNGFNEWSNATHQGFGTAIVLEGPWKDIEPRIDILRSLGYIAGKTFDPSYPIRDGSMIHHIPLHTCAYVFVPNKEQDIHGVALMSLFPLHH